jgi:hypothetical protein
MTERTPLVFNTPAISKHVRADDQNLSVRCHMTGVELVDEEGQTTQEGLRYLKLRLKAIKRFGDANVEISSNSAEGLRKLIQGLPDQKLQALNKAKCKDAYVGVMNYLGDKSAEVDAPRPATGNSIKIVLRAL